MLPYPLLPVLNFLYSKTLSIYLFLVFGLLLAISTFFTDKNAYTAPVSYPLLAFLACMLIACTWRNWKRLSLAAILIHAGCALVLLGGLISATGYVATVNVYEGGSTSSAFRWDQNKEIQLPFTLRVKQIRLQYYPTPVKIGVLVNDVRHKLVETKTGDSFQVNGSTIKVGPLDLSSRSISLEITPPTGEAYQYATSTETLDNNNPLAFQLVAFKTPFLKKSWADLTLESESKPVFSSATSVNDPMKWHGLKFFLTAINKDPNGISYAGIQIVKDQGVPLSFFGFAVISAGLIALLRKRKFTPEPKK